MKILGHIPRMREAYEECAYEECGHKANGGHGLDVVSCHLNRRIPIRRLGERACGMREVDARAKAKRVCLRPDRYPDYYSLASISVPSHAPA